MTQPTQEQINIDHLRAPHTWMEGFKEDARLLLAYNKGKEDEIDRIVEKYNHLNNSKLRWIELGSFLLEEMKIKQGDKA